MTEAKNAVFLSYASQDSDVARRLFEALRARDIIVWFDQSELRGGDRWDQQIRQQIRDCALFIALVSVNTQARQEGYFRLEWRLADQRTHLMARSKAFIVPVAIGAMPDSTGDVPESFLAVQWVRLSDGESPAALVERVWQLLSPASLAATLPDATLADRNSQFSTPAPSSIPENSIAVLPFTDMSAKQDQEYFADGLSEALIDLLTQVRDLRVSARTSSFYFKGRSADVSTIGEKLRVANVLEGSVRKMGRAIRVTVRLVRTDDGYHCWSKTFDRDVRDIFKVQDEIASLVFESLKARLLHAQEVVNQHVTESGEAYDQFLIGRQFFNRGTAEAYLRAVTALQQAVSLDPGYASAYALLAMSRNMLAELGTDSIAADAEQAIAAAERAVSLAPGLPDAYSARGYVRFLRQWDWSGARADFESAVRLGPRDSASHRRYALLMAALGQFSDAVAAARLGTEIEPLYVNSWLILGICLSGAGQHLAAHKALSDALEISPESSRVRAQLTRAELLLGRPQDALAINAQQQISKWRLSNDAMAEHALGNATASEIALVSLIDRHGQDAPSLIADVYAWRHDLDSSAEWLERAYRQRDRSLNLIKCDPCLNGLHNSPRYHALLRNMNLPA